MTTGGGMTTGGVEEAQSKDVLTYTCKTAAQKRHTGTIQEVLYEYCMSTACELIMF